MPGRFEDVVGTVTAARGGARADGAMIVRVLVLRLAAGSARMPRLRPRSRSAETADVLALVGDPCQEQASSRLREVTSRPLAACDMTYVLVGSIAWAASPRSRSFPR